MALEEDLNTVQVATFNITLLKMIDPESARILNVERNVPVYLASIYIGSKSPWRFKIAHVTSQVIRHYPKTIRKHVSMY
jgi:hypothetical protein